jgi:undecaprenyl-diphosphatase
MFFLKAGFWDAIERWDRDAFLKINGDWTLPVLDAILPFMRHSYTWMPLYLFIFLFVIFNFRRHSFWWILLFVCTIALVDMTGTYVFKHNFQRLRPCANPDLTSMVRMLVDHCAGYGFTSNHAANHFGMAAFMFITFRPVFKNWMWLAFAWAFLVGYAQVYVGLHYPLDVIAGALVGLILGLSMGALFNKRYGFAIFEEQQPRRV